MTSIVKNSKLTVRVVEEVILNGSSRGSTVKHEVEGINEVSERVMTIPTSAVTVLSASNTVGAGTFVSSSLKYIRLTNLDDTNFLRVSFVSGSSSSANTADFKLDPNRSMLFTNTQFSGSADSKNFNQFSGFTALKASADTASVDLEIFVAST